MIRRASFVLALGLTGLSSPVAEAAVESPALTVGEGSTAAHHVVGLGRDVLIAGTARRDVAAIQGSVRIDGVVEGGVVALGGDVLLGTGARVGGDVFALGGEVSVLSGARIEGRSAAYPTIGKAWLTLLEGPSLGMPADQPVVVATKFALLAAWMVLAALLFAATGDAVLETSVAVARQPGRHFLLGLTGVLALVLTTLGLAAVFQGVVGAPLLLLAVLIGVVLKLWGMVAVFHALGCFLAARAGRRRWLPLNTAALGLVVLGVLKFVPWVGVWAWTAATLVGVGATLGTRFGSRRPWFPDARPG